MPNVRLEHKSNLPQLFQERGWTLKNSLPGLMRQAGRLTAVSLAYQAQPFGDDDKAEALGKVATNRDIYKVYTTPGKAFSDISDPKMAKAFWTAVNKQLWAKAQAILQRFGHALRSTPIATFDGGAQHRQVRNNRGRVTGAQKPVMIVRDPQRLAKYVASETDKVGQGKGGWASCARVLGGVRGIPRWITNHKSPAAVSEKYGTDVTEIILTNKVPYASEILTASQKSQAVDIAHDKLLKSIQIAERHAARSTGF